MKLPNIAEKDGPDNWENVKTKDTEEAYRHAMQQEQAARHQMAVFKEKLKPYSKHMVRAYKPEEFNVTIIHPIKIDNYWYGVPVDTPNSTEMQKAVEFYSKRYERAQKLRAKYDRNVQKLRKQVRNETLKNIKDSASPKMIPSSQVPRRVYYTPNNYFNNPYWNTGEEVIANYAGPVGHFPTFTQSERNILVELDRTLIRNGLDGMTTMYGCAVKWKRGQRDNEFVAFGAKGRLIWKRIHNNIIYVDGKKISVSHLTLTTPKSNDYQEKILEPLKTTPDPMKGLYNR